MMNVYQLVQEFENLCIRASNAVKNQKKYRLIWLLEQLGLAHTTYRDRLKQPRLWTTDQLKRLSELLPEDFTVA